MIIQYMIEITLLDYNYLKFSTFYIVISSSLIVYKSKEDIILKICGNRNVDLIYECKEKLINLVNNIYQGKFFLKQYLKNFH